MAEFSHSVTLNEEKCVGCGACERACPQHLEVIDHLRRCTAFFEGGAQ